MRFGIPEGILFLSGSLGRSRGSRGGNVEIQYLGLNGTAKSGGVLYVLPPVPDLCLVPP